MDKKVKLQEENADLKIHNEELKGRVSRLREIVEIEQSRREVYITKRKYPLYAWRCTSWSTIVILVAAIIMGIAAVYTISERLNDVIEYDRFFIDRTYGENSSVQI